MLSRLRSSFTHLPQTLRLVYRSSPVGMVVLLLLTLVSAVLPVAIAWVGKQIVDAVVAGARDLTLRWVLIELAVVVAQAATQRALALCRSLIGARLAIDINVTILDKAISLELADFENSEFYDKLTRARREASSRPLSVVSETFQLLQNTLTLAGYITVLVQYSAWAMFALVAASIPAAVVEVRFSNMAFRLRNWRSPVSRRLNYLEYVIANDDHVKEVKLYNLGPTLLGRYKSLAESFFSEDKALSQKRTVWALLLSLLGTGAFYGAYATMALSAAAGAITLGTLTFYVMAFRQGQQSFQSILSALGSMYEDNLYMSNLFEYLAHQSPKPESRARVEASSERGIRFENVGFKYPGRDTWALQNVDLAIAEGESLAIVGHNGSGKTTLIKLLTGLYSPTEGRILIDGKDLRAWDQTALRSKMSVVFQDFNQYQMKLSENVGFGSVAHLEEAPRLARAIDNGGASELVSSLPSGVDTSLGRWFKDGLELSGGQWQKVALARAFMREESDILILDEPTAALDAEAEHAVFERFASLTQGRTSILISHRFPTTRMADRIIVMEQGCITESGTHTSLLEKNGRYAELFKLQARGYL
jgi:ATP-binding cassette, subfamily B, bacterial